MAAPILCEFGTRHYPEQVLRLIVGGATVIFAPSMWYPDLFRLFGWLLVVPAVALLLLPWRWHHAFGILSMECLVW
jgi:hypothetical protein